MGKAGSLVLALACSAAVGVLASVLTFFLGFAACRLLAWLRGNDELMNLMWGVEILAMQALPVGFSVSLFLCGRLVQRRSQHAGGNGASGFPIQRSDRPTR
jgi:hypothetical protein